MPGHGSWGSSLPGGQGRGGTAGDAGEGRHAEVGHGGLAGGAGVQCLEFLPDRGEGDLNAFELAEPAVLSGFGDPCGQAVADEDQAGPLGGVDPEQGASFAGHLVDAAGPVGAAAVTEGDLAALEGGPGTPPIRLRWAWYSSAG